MDDIIKSIKAFLYDRAASPLLGAFIVAWATWNYKTIIVLLSNEKFNVKFDYIDTLYKIIELEILGIMFSIPQGILIDGFMFPSLMTIFYIYGYPRLAKPVYEHSLKTQLALKTIKQKEEKNKLLTVEESNKMHLEFLNLENKFEDETIRYREQIKALQNLLNETNKSSIPDVSKNISVADVPKKPSEKKSLSPISEEILKLYINLTDKYMMDINDISNKVDRSLDLVAVNISPLVKNNYLNEQNRSAGKLSTYTITIKGKQYLLDNFPEQYL